MNRIDTDVESIIVEIEGTDYPIAPKTIEIADKLFAIEADAKGKPAYKMWLAELRVLLGDAAVNELFHSGKAENVDRIQSIYIGVADAFNHHYNAIEEDSREKDLRAVATALAPINELLRHVKALDKK